MQSSGTADGIGALISCAVEPSTWQHLRPDLGDLLVVRRAMLIICSELERVLTFEDCATLCTRWTQHITDWWDRLVKEAQADKVLALDSLLVVSMQLVALEGASPR